VGVHQALARSLLWIRVPDEGTEAAMVSPLQGQGKQAENGAKPSKQPASILINRL
jgi:hypothetical protein